MKKFILCLMMLCMLFSLAACGTDTPDTTGPQGSSSTNSDGNNVQEHPNAPSLTVNGTKLQLYAKAEPILKALGTANSVNELPTCAIGEMDRQYAYDSFYVQTYSLEGVEYIFSFWFADDLIKTDEGVKIGDTKEAVEAAYGAAAFDGTNCYVITSDGGELRLILKDGVVSSISYTVIVGA